MLALREKGIFQGSLKCLEPEIVNAAMEIIDFEHKELRISNFKTRPGESWCIYGDNRSGIDTFTALVAGNLQNFTVSLLHLPENPGITSFKHQQDLFEEELRLDNSDFLNKIDPGTPAKDFLPEYEANLSLIRSFGMENSLEQGYRQLSSGQCRKLLLLRELLGGATFLIVQNPYDGLDETSCNELNRTLNVIVNKGVQLLTIVSSINDLPPCSSHLALIAAGEMSFYGRKEQILSLMAAAPLSSKETNKRTDKILRHHSAPLHGKTPLVILRQGFAGYGGKKLFHNLNLDIFPGDHTLITGSNGCGKSTLLDIITGDNPKCYANNLEIFGKKRGSGESIWEIKQHMGIISPTLHRDHRVPGTVLQIILSGLFDSIGLYRKISEQQIRAARHWLKWIELLSKEKTSFRELCYAEQRLVLIARALIKLPKLLILDEPTQGLDDVNRNQLIDLLEKITTQNISTILFVSHRKDEYRSFFKQHIELDTYS